MKKLYTRWGRELEEDHVLEEYPRPMMVRSDFVCLNGKWDYSFTDSYKKPEKYDGKILVPFSPETLLSGVERQLQPNEYLWYHRCLPIDVQAVEKNQRALLHFGAVDQACCLFINGKQVRRHTGGYLPFTADITEFLLPGEHTAELVLAVKDLTDTSFHSRGKQKLKKGGMFYTAQSGIWQTVWMEYVPTSYIEELQTETDYDKGQVKIRVCMNKCADEGDRSVKIEIEAPELYQEKEHVAFAETESIVEATGKAGQWIVIDLPEKKSWTCEQPYLYYFTVTAGEDRVVSYFGLRIFTVEKDEADMMRICLNHQPQFQKGVLDQGYWSDGLYTAPADEALIFDIQQMKDMGFNMIRKHIKIEPLRWYYHCDRLGMVVWQDMVNGGSYYMHWFVTYMATAISLNEIHFKDHHTKLLSRREHEGQREFVREMKETIHLLKNHPSIAVWVIFNEGWGQFHAEKVTKIARREDPTRLIDQASGWFDQKGGDFKSIHNYYFKLKFMPENHRAVVLSEFGGYSLREEEHSACDKLYGYGMYKDRQSLQENYEKLQNKIDGLRPDGMCASVYTQLSDVEEEVNGIYTFDREVRKIK